MPGALHAMLRQCLEFTAPAYFPLREVRVTAVARLMSTPDAWLSFAREDIKVLRRFYSESNIPLPEVGNESDTLSLPGYRAQVSLAEPVLGDTIVVDYEEFQPSWLPEPLDAPTPLASGSVCLQIGRTAHISIQNAEPEHVSTHDIVTYMTPAKVQLRIFAKWSSWIK